MGRQFNRKFGNKTKETVFEQALQLLGLIVHLFQLVWRNVSLTVATTFAITITSTYQLREIKKCTLLKKSKALVIEAFDGHIYINIEDKIYTSRKLLDHEIYSQEFDQAPEKTKKKDPSILPHNLHLWKLASFEKYLRRIGKTLLEYQAEKSA